MLIPANQSPQQRIERRRSQIEQVRAVEGQVFKSSYRIHVTGNGEKKVQINFPVYFMEKPLLTHGGELEDGITLVVGNYPRCSAMVAQWKTTARGSRTFYVGALVAVWVEGDASYESVVHIHVEGKALQNPLPTS